MRVRKGFIAAAIGAAFVASWATVAEAQGQTPAVLKPPAPVVTGQAPRTPAPKPLPPQATPGTFLPGLEHVFTPPAVLGEAWARALRAVLDGMKHVVDAQRLAVDAIRPKETAPSAMPARVVPAWRAVWLPARAVREAIAVSPVQLGPVAAEPPTEAGRDTRGEHAVLLGARMELPWMVP